MNTSKTGSVTSIIEKRRSLVEKVAVIEAELKSLDSALQNLEGHPTQLVTSVDVQNGSGLLQDNNLAELRQSIKTELEKLYALKEHFFQKKLKIGVVGRAKQGKSQLLRSFTGLTGVEIPNGGKQNCTGVYCSLHHEQVEETYAEVWFYSEQSLLDEVIGPCYEKLFLGSKPKTLQEFAARPLPLLPSVFSSEAQQEGMYLHLARHQIHVEKYRHLLGQASPRRISQEEIREYVAQETADGDRSFFNYLAVREVKIVCQFPQSDVGKIVFVDIPGIGDTGNCNEQYFINKLVEDVDAILFVRMPKSSGDRWQEVDVKLYDKVRAAMVDLPIQERSFMVMNRTEAHSRFHDNLKICQDLALDTNKNINVVEYIITNCTNTQETQKLLERVVHYIEEKNTDLGNKEVLLSQQKLAIVQSKVNAKLKKVGKPLDLSTQDTHGFALFEIKFKELSQELTDGLEKLLRELRKTRESVDWEFKKQVDVALQAGRSDTKIPSIEEIKHRYSVEKSYPIVYEKYLNEIRSHLSKHLLLLDVGLKRSLDKVKSQVAEIFVKKGRLGGLTEARGAEFIHAVANQIPDELIPGIPSQLKYGFKTLAEYQLSYRGFLQHRLRQYLDGLTANEPVAQKLTPSTSAEQVHLNLKIAHAETLSKCENALKQLLGEPNQAAFAIVEEFFDTILRSPNIESEWRIFLQEMRGHIWREFQQTSDGSETKGDVLDSVEPDTTTMPSQSDLITNGRRVR
ncbi:hypothetical protein NUACC21_58020 [Scytonema sp. NUACC21]